MRRGLYFLVSPYLAFNSRKLLTPMLTVPCLCFGIFVGLSSGYRHILFGINIHAANIEDGELTWKEAALKDRKAPQLKTLSTNVFVLVLGRARFGGISDNDCSA